eukprot:TRINITY_DN50535_c0_g1_i1.p1 TRINITY_DN50535_c0_g1~~TRINITY_DN50535_c0_g1_i1.p1  ORF type:complete len:222 (-),score=32.50 TRINITY_DN50535_c0_g1_i1:38-703(-)
MTAIVTGTVDGSLDPFAVLRKRQMTEYHKLCGELRLRPNSGVLLSFTEVMPSHDTSAADSLIRSPGTASGLSTPISTFDSSKSMHIYDFSSNYLGDRQILPICASLSVDPMLTAVLMSSTGMRDKGMVGFCEQLKRCSSLEVIDVSNNRFSIAGARACLSLAEGLPALWSVNARDTCLDEDFCAKRGLSADYAAVCRKLQIVLENRRDGASKAEELKPLSD